MRLAHPGLRGRPVHGHALPGENISATWRQLLQWLTDSRFRHAEHPCLEEHLKPHVSRTDEELLLDLYSLIAG
jgi:DNA gyrase inhibitor GyrI